MKIHRNTLVAALVFFLFLLVVLLSLCLYVNKIEGMYQKREKVAQKRLKRMEAIIEEDADGYAIYVNDKFYDYKKYDTDESN